MRNTLRSTVHSFLLSLTACGVAAVAGAQPEEAAASDSTAPEATPAEASDSGADSNTEGSAGLSASAGAGAAASDANDEEPEGGGSTEAQVPFRPGASVLANEPDSWFYRPPMSVSFGDGDKKLELTFYGFLQFDALHDTTQSFPEDIGPRLVARTDTFDGTAGRTTFTAKNTRLGFRLNSMEVGGVRPTFIFEGDFFGNPPEQPHPHEGTNVTESAFYDSPTFRLRHGLVNLENDYVDVLIGQTHDLFGWENYFFPATAEFFGLPSMVFSRPLQARLSKSLGKEGALGVDIAAAAVRPVQRDSGVPDLRAGLRVKFNDVKALRMSGNGDAEALPFAIGVSSVLRQYSVDSFTPPPTQAANTISGWGLSAEALIPVVPVTSLANRANALTLTGAFVMGTGIGDLMTATGGANFPMLPNAAQANPPPEYHANIDPGIVSFDHQGVLTSINWQGFRAGLQYYLPPSGRVILALNYSQAHSDNMADLFPKGGAEIELLGRVADRQQYMDGTLFFEATNTVRLGLHGSYMTARYLDGDEPSNIRGRFQAMYSF